MSVIFGIFLMIVFCVREVAGERRTLDIDIAHDCPDVLHRVDSYDEVWISNTKRNRKHAGKAWWRHYKGACRMSFMTDVEDHVLCVNVFSIEIISKDLELKFFTTSYRPERMYNKKHYRHGSWCTDEKLFTMVLTTDGLPSDRDSGIDLQFKVMNKSRDEVEMTYFMDSADQCDVTHFLPKDTSLRLETHRFPEVDTLPATCEVSVTADSADEYTRVCVNFLFFNLSSECTQELTITEVDEEHYKTNSTHYDCNTETSDLKQVCSVDKTLTFTLTRMQPNGGYFEIEVTAKRTPFWESIETQKSELRGLAAAKGFTVFIATVDAVIALSIAFISMSTRFPIGPLHWVAEIFAPDPETPQYGPGESKPHGCHEVTTLRIQNIFSRNTMLP